MAGIFKMPPQAPPSFNHTPATILASTRLMLDNTRNLQDEIVANIRPEDATFNSVLLPLADDENRTIATRKLFKFFGSTSTSKELRDASNSYEALASDFDSQTLMREDLFQLVDAVFRKQENLDAESQYYLDQTYRAFLDNGLGIEDGPDRRLFTNIRTELRDLRVAYLKSINTTSGIWLTVQELDGLPMDSLASLKAGTGENTGKVWLPYKKPHFEHAIRFVRSGTTRQRIFIGHDNRCLDNVARLKRTILLRDEAARLRGYPNHAEANIRQKMAKSTKFVNDFIDDIKERLAPIAELELDALKRLKQADIENTNVAKSFETGIEETARFHHWDFGYYSNLTKVQTHSFDEKKFSEYFPLETALAGMMSTFSRLFGLQFCEISPQHFSEFGADHLMTWHPDVMVFTVWEDSINGGGFLGYLYLDLFPRDHKYNHAGHYNLRPGFIAPSGERQYPASALVMNLLKSLPNQPGLLKHNDARSLFHELGHAIHSQTTRARYAIFHGTHAKDFGEIPSIMLENWWWTPSVIKELSCHYSYLSDSYLKSWKETQPDATAKQPPRKLDDETIQNLVKSKYCNAALGALKQCHIAKFDMMIHSPKTREEIEEKNLSELWNKINSEVTMMEGLENLGGGWEWGHGSARFRAIMAGYAATYYAYPLGKTYAQDLFASAFAKDPMSREVGMRFRKTVLEPGGTQNGMDLMTNFLGRKPNTVARYKELSLM